MKYIPLNPFESQMDVHYLDALDEDVLTVDLLDKLPDSSFVFAPKVEGIYGLYSNKTLYIPNRAIWVFMGNITESLDGMKAIKGEKYTEKILYKEDLWLYTPKGLDKKYIGYFESLVRLNVVNIEYDLAFEDTVVMSKIPILLNLNPNDKHMVFITDFPFYSDESKAFVIGLVTENIIWLNKDFIKSQYSFDKLFSHEAMHYWDNMHHCEDELCIMHPTEEGITLCKRCQKQIKSPYYTDYFKYKISQQYLDDLAKTIEDGW
jgi:hypothetical protein